MDVVQEDGCCVLGSRQLRMLGILGEIGNGGWSRRGQLRAGRLAWN
jgi:hypothetical protein